MSIVSKKLTLFDRPNSQQPSFRMRLPGEDYPLAAKAPIRSVLCEKDTYRMRFSQVTKTSRANIVSRGISRSFLRLTESIVSEARVLPPVHSCARSTFGGLSGISNCKRANYPEINTCRSGESKSTEMNTYAKQRRRKPHRMNTYANSGVGAPLGRAKVYPQDEFLRVNKVRAKQRRVFGPTKFRRPRR